MKRRPQNSALTDQNRIVAPPPEHGDFGAHVYDSRSANEHTFHTKRIAKFFGEHDLSNCRVHLSSIGVSCHIDTQHSETLLGRLDVLREEDHTGAGCENRHSCCNPIPDSARQIFRLHQPQHRRRFTTRDHQRIYAREVGGRPYGTGVSAEFTEDRTMSRPVALECKNSILRHKLTTLDAKASPPV
jgi:hypothetical protein